MKKPRLYLDFGKGYEKDKADTFKKILSKYKEIIGNIFDEKE